MSKDTMGRIMLRRTIGMGEVEQEFDATVGASVREGGKSWKTTVHQAKHFFIEQVEIIRCPSPYENTYLQTIVSNG